MGSRCNRPTAGTPPTCCAAARTRCTRSRRRDPRGAASSRAVCFGRDEGADGLASGVLEHAAAIALDTLKRRDEAAAAWLDGVREIRGPLRPMVGVVALMATGQGLFVVLFVVFVTERLGGGAAEVGLLRGVQAVGAMGLAVFAVLNIAGRAHAGERRDERLWLPFAAALLTAAPAAATSEPAELHS